jgi:hypothetical protein
VLVERRWRIGKRNAFAPAGSSYTSCERREDPHVTKTLSEWLQEGEALYNQALSEYHDIEQQLDDLESKLLAKRQELNQIAQVVGKPPIETSRRLSAELVEDHGPNSVPNSPATIARALTGRGLGR